MNPPDAVPAALAGCAIGQYSAAALAWLLADVRAGPPREFVVAVVPGSSEQWGHHRAPPPAAEARGERISRDFAARIARAWALLRGGVVRSVLLSGGSIDARRPDYNEALRGREHMIARYGDAFGGREALAARILVDPLAHHSTTNLRNAARLCTDLGLDRALIATTMPPNPWLLPAGVPVAYQTSQGWYFLHQHASTFAWRCRRALGYTLGEFAWFETRVAGERVTAIAHTDLPRERLLRDAYGP